MKFHDDQIFENDEHKICDVVWMSIWILWGKNVYVSFFVGIRGSIWKLTWETFRISGEGLGTFKPTLMPKPISYDAA